MVTGRIEVNPNVMLGKPVVKGTRIPVKLILRKFSEGASMSDLTDAYPRLTVEDIHACIGYDADMVAHEPKGRSRHCSAMRLLHMKECGTF